MESEFIASDDRQFAALLQKHSPPLSGQAFTRDVLAALPPRKHAGSARRALLCIAAAALGIGLAWQQGAFTLSAGNGLREFFRETAHHFVDSRGWLALAVTACSLALAFWRSPRTLGLQ